MDRNVQSEPFVVEPGKQYKFQMVLPFARTIDMEVLDPSGKPLTHVAVAAITAAGQRVFPTPTLPDYDKYEPALTDSDGHVSVTGLAPGEDVALLLRFLSPEAQDDASPAVLGCVCTRALVGRESGFCQATFDPRPVRVEGAVVAEPGAEGMIVECLVETQGSERAISVLRTRTDDQGRFRFVPAPVGRVRFSCRWIVNSRSKSLEPEGVVETRPGVAPAVRLSAAGLDVVHRRHLGATQNE